MSVSLSPSPNAKLEHVRGKYFNVGLNWPARRSPIIRCYGRPPSRGRFVYRVNFLNALRDFVLFKIWLPVSAAAVVLRNCSKWIRGATSLITARTIVPAPVRQVRRAPNHMSIALMSVVSRVRSPCANGRFHNDAGGGADGRVPMPPYRN